MFFLTAFLVAWFQARSSGADPRHMVEAGSSNITISNVVAHKYEYPMLNSSDRAASDGHNETYEFYGSHANQHQQDITDVPVDIPDHGWGYYLVGDANIAQDMGARSADAWTYAAASKMETTGIGSGNKCAIFHVYLKSTWNFGIRLHDYSGPQNSTTNTDIVFANAYDNVAITGDTGSKQAHSTSNGWFNIYLNDSNGISLATDSPTIQQPRSRKPAANRQGVNPKRTISLGHRIYARGTIGGETLTKVHIWKNGGSAYTSRENDPSMEQIGSSNVYVVTLTEDPKNYDRIIFRSATKQTGDLVVSDAFSKRYFYNFSQGSTYYQSCSFNDYYQLATSQNSWGSDPQAISFSTSGTYSNRYSIEYTFNAAGEFKLIVNGTWYGWFNKTGIASELTSENSSENQNFRAPGPGKLTIWMTPSVNTYGTFMDIFDGVEGAITWSYANYTVTFDPGDGGSVTPTSKTVTYGSTYGTLPTPSKTGYNFDGWFTSGGDQIQAGDTVSLTGNLTLYAHWTVKSTSITFNKRDGTGGADSATLTYGQSASDISVPTKAGHSFGGYYTESDGTGTQIYTGGGVFNPTVNDYVLAHSGSTVNLYAKWTPNAYSVTLELNGGTNNGSALTSYTYGVGATLPKDMTKSGCLFAGWYDNPSFTGDRVSSISTTDTGDKEYYARWIACAKDLYIHNARSAWSTGSSKLFLHAWGSGWESDELLSGRSAHYSDFTNVYVIHLPSSATGFLIYHNTDGSFDAPVTNSQKTKDMTSVNNAKWADTMATENDSLNSFDMLTIQNANRNDGKPFDCWGQYHYDAGLKPGFYFVGAGSSCDSHEDFASLSFEDATRMNNERASSSDYASLKNVFFGTDPSFFMIWKIDSNMNWWEYATRDGSSSATEDNGKLKITTIGTYNVYVNTSDNVLVTTSNAPYYATINFTRYMGGAGRTFEMQVGDAPANGAVSGVNRFVHETKIEVEAGDTFYLDSYAGTTQYKADLTIAGAAEPFITNMGTSSGTATYRFAVAGSYTFYWTREGGISVAPVPTTGPGYYILLDQNSGGSYPTFSYASAVKMNTKESWSSGYKAYYNSFYASANQKIAFRSYINNLDTSYKNTVIYYNDTSLGTSSDADVYKVNGTGNTPADAYGVVMKKAGYYNFAVDGSNIRIYSWNPLTMNCGSKGADTSTKVKNLNSTIVLAVTFTANNIYASNIGVNVFGGGSGLGSKLAYAVSAIDASLGGSSPYDYMRAQVYDSSLTTSTFTSGSCTLSASGYISANDSSPHTIYIFIDYDPASSSSLSTSAMAADTTFSIRASQR